ncbi:hypothetical protein HK096_007062 [Nowakowskiella sp. JEL0078]|nr:hypothetical protein HK096_007062 [Nowakowskiella sp. JEL0078]
MMGFKLVSNIFLVVLFVSAIYAQNALASYKCDTSKCLPPSCRCATLSPPVASPPQFVLLTFDDTIAEDVYATALSLLKDRKNPNGCPALATFYAQVFYTNPSLAQQWRAAGHEIADHSVTHTSPFAGSFAELEGMRAYYTTYAGISRGQISGVRFPFRNYTLAGIERVAKMNFTYDSSMASSDAEAIWPYTLDYGVVTDCNAIENICGQTVNAKGLWELPMAQSGEHLMDSMNDPTVTAPISTSEAVTIMTNSFNLRYKGNRAPYGVYLHPVWYGKAQPPTIPNGTGKLAAINSLLTNLMSNPDVWMVTGQQVIEYMKNPVSAADLQKQSYMQCPTLPTGICNGLTPSLAVSCSLPNGTISSCFGCPSSYPSLDNPSPSRTDNTRCLVPDTCSGVYWDPIGCKCLCTDASCAYKDNSRKINLDESSLNPTNTNTSTNSTKSTSQETSTSRSSGSDLA